MKIRTRRLPYEKVMARPRPQHKIPMKPNIILSSVIRVLAEFDLFPTKFTYRKHRMEALDPKEPVLIQMIHSSFIDLKIAS